MTIVEDAIAWLGKGFRPIPVYPNSKKPRGESWGTKRQTEEDLRSFYRDVPDGNLGICLGSPGGDRGLIDIDVDDPVVGQQTLAKIFPGGVPETLGYVSSQSTVGPKYHLLFLWDSRLSEFSEMSAVFAGGEHFAGLEVRIGASPMSPKQTQSVIPPSVVNGYKRTWLIKPLRRCPDELVAYLAAHAASHKRKGKKAPGAIKASAWKGSSPVRTTTDYLPKVDWNSLLRHTDLPSLVQELTGSEMQSGNNVSCPRHDDLRPSMHLWIEEDRWAFYCHSCGIGGDAVEFYAGMTGLSRVEAAVQIMKHRAVNFRRRVPRTERVMAWKLDEWQALINELVALGEHDLWASEKTLAYLRGRGLSDDTIKHFRLGWLESRFSANAFTPDEFKWSREWNRGFSVQAGITIPYLHPDYSYSDPTPKWLGINVRRFSGAQKYMAATGTDRRFPFPYSAVDPALPLLLLEGEFDAMLAWQELRGRCNVVTFGSASNKPDKVLVQSLLRCRDWLLCFDNDDAGREAATEWLAMHGSRSRLALLPDGVKDLTDLVVRGGSLEQWWGTL